MFSYEYLKMCAESNSKIGDWKGSEVYATSARDVFDKGHYDWYVIYDDNNKLVGWINGYWQVAGYVSETGNVRECRREKYQIPVEKANFHSKREEIKEMWVNTVNSFGYSNGKMKYKTETENEYSNENMNSENEVIADVRLGLLIDETLQGARNMTVNSLLEGFNYGLEEAVG